MNIENIIANVDALLKSGEDKKAKQKLIDAIAECAESEPDNVVGQSALLNELGGFYRARKIFDKGEEAYLKAKQLLEERRKHVYIVDGPEPGCGCCGCDIQNFENSEHLTHAEIIYADERETVNYATTLNNLAGLYRMSGQLQKSVKTFDAAITVYKNCDKEVSPDYLASVYSNKGLVYLDMRQISDAKAMFLKAKDILEKGGDYKFAMATTVSNLGFASVMENKLSEAIPLFKEAKVLFTEAGSHDMAQNCEELLCKLGAGQ